ncbi:hypothetical protein [Oceaniglobus indicus]|uniref:hypothetical protein n=1 Tax=Oceaniglobus indicus TaxID=2047749 RepID=UPI0013045018|nr:hypothetical protein [Oceaniglobus indicus]
MEKTFAQIGLVVMIGGGILAWLLQSFLLFSLLAPTVSGCLLVAALGVKVFEVFDKGG